MRPTQRTYTDCETGDIYRLYVNDSTGNIRLIAEKDKCVLGESPESFYLAAHTGADIKLNTKKVIHVSMGEFYRLKEGETVTHRRFVGFKQFSKM